MPTDDTLGTALAVMMQALADAIDRTPDKAQRDQLLAKQGEVHAQLQPLIDRTVRQNIVEYWQATSAVNRAIAALKGTQQDIAKVAQEIDMLAQVVSALSKLASAVA